jgi:hypothetical protein
MYTSLRCLLADLSSLIDSSSPDENIFSSQLLRFLDIALNREKKRIDKLKHRLDRLEKILQIHFDRDLEDDKDQEASDV